MRLRRPGWRDQPRPPAKTRLARATRRLTTQELVELLKMPTCLGPVRRVVLDHLGNRYRQRFANHWEFVRFAESRGLGLDLTSPPVRPRSIRETMSAP